MTTQSGQSYKEMEGTPQHQQQPEVAETSHTHHSPTSRELADLTRMMQAMLEDCRLREAEIAEDHWQWECENEERMKGMH